MRLFNWIALSGVIISLGTVAASAAETLPRRHYAWETSCRYPLPSDGGFTPHELEAWANYLCLGRPLDMREFDGERKAGCDPRSIGEWPATRRLSSRFLRTVLSFSPYNETVGNKDIQIYCALFQGKLDLSRIESRYHIWFVNTLFSDNLDLSDADLLSGLIFQGSFIEGNLDATNLETKGDVSLIHSQVKLEFRLRRARIDGNLNLDGSHFGEFKDLDYATDLDLVQVTGDFLMSKGTVFKASVTARRGRINGSVVISDAWFEKPLDARDSMIGGDLVISNPVTVEARFDLTNVRVNGTAAFGASKFANDLRSNGLHIGGSLVLGDGSGKRVVFHKNLELNDAKIGGALQAFNVEVMGDFRASGIEVADDLNLSMSPPPGTSWPGSIFHGAVELVDATCGGSFVAHGAIFRRDFAADRARISGSIFLTGTTTFGADVRLVGVQIGGQINARRADFKGGLIAERLAVRGSVFLSDGAVFKSQIQLLSSKIDSHLDLSGSLFNDTVDLTGAEIGGALILASTAGDPAVPRWRSGSRLILKNVKVDTVHDASLSWHWEDATANRGQAAFIPLDLTNFTYASLNGLDPSRSSDTMATRDLEWYLAWIESDESFVRVFNPQPYTQLASALRESGDHDKADDILFYMRNHEFWADSTPLGRKVILGLQWLLIGYGYANWRSLIPFAVLLVLGAFLCSKANELRSLSLGERFWYSLDRALPIVRLGAATDDNAPSNWVSSYFYVHQIAGFILVSFLLAGLSGFAG